MPMAHTQWVSPRRFEDDEGSASAQFLEQFFSSTGPMTLCDLATDCWKTKGHSHDSCHIGMARLDLALHRPILGKRNMILTLMMPDETLWIARLRNPFATNKTEDSNESRMTAQRLSLESELATMEFVRRNTSVPVPVVYGYDLTHSNPLGLSYMLMEYLRGRPFPFPFNERGFILERDILKVHCQLVNITAQLSNLTSSKIGRITYTAEGKFTPEAIIDRKDRKYGPFRSSEDFFVERAHVVHATELALQRSPEHIETAQLHVEAAEYAARLRALNYAFPLKHVDLHWQNVLVDKDCIVVGVIDWEWAHTVPVEAFKVLPFNIASLVIPQNSAQTASHEVLTRKLFAALGGNPDVVETMNSVEAKIAAILERYNWPAVRRDHAEALVTLVEEAKMERWGSEMYEEWISTDGED